jgi:hypothetical protein
MILVSWSQGKETVMKEHTVKDKNDRVAFVGERIGHASTRKQDSLRWTELNIYRTEKSNYVIEKLGRAVVYHRLGETCASGSKITGYQISAESEPCETCDPDIPEDIGFNAEEIFVHEVTRSSAVVVDSPDRVREALAFKKPQEGRPTMSWVASEVLRVAGSVDPGLAPYTGVDVRVE